ncbi:unnamed protein product [Arctogadus glacialis]
MSHTNTHTQTHKHTHTGLSHDSVFSLFMEYPSRCQSFKGRALAMALHRQRGCTPHIHTSKMVPVIHVPMEGRPPRNHTPHAPPPPRHPLDKEKVCSGKFSDRIDKNNIPYCFYFFHSICIAYTYTGLGLRWENICKIR